MSTLICNVQPFFYINCSQRATYTFLYRITDARKLQFSFTLRFETWMHLDFGITSSRGKRIMMGLARFYGYKLSSFFLSCTGIPLNVVLYLNELQLLCPCYIRCGLHINPEARHTHLIDLCQSTVFIHRSIMFISRLYTEPEVKKNAFSLSN